MRSTTQLVVILLAIWVLFLISGCASTHQDMTITYPRFISSVGARTPVAFRILVPYHPLNRAVILRTTEIRMGHFSSSYRDLDAEVGLIAWIVRFKLLPGVYNVEAILIRTDARDKFKKGRLVIQ